MDTIFRLLEPFLLSATAPVFTIQSAMLCGIAIILVFLIFYTTKDIIARSDSFLFMLFSLLVVTALPVVGFLLYLLIRPVHTKLQRNLLVELVELRKELKAVKPQSSVAKKIVKKLTKKAPKKIATTKKK